MKNIIVTLSLVFALVACTDPSAPTCPEPDAGTPSTYELGPDRLSFDDATAFCAERGGHLVTFESPEEYQSFHDVAYPVARDGSQVWTGFEVVIGGGDYTYVLIGAGQLMPIAMDWPGMARPFCEYDDPGPG